MRLHTCNYVLHLKVLLFRPKNQSKKHQRKMARHASPPFLKSSDGYMLQSQ